MSATTASPNSGRMAAPVANSGPPQTNTTSATSSGPKTPKHFLYGVAVSRVLSVDELEIEFIRQFFGLTTAEQATEKRKEFDEETRKKNTEALVAQHPKGVTAEHVAVGFIKLKVTYGFQDDTAAHQSYTERDDRETVAELARGALGVEEAKEIAKVARETAARIMSNPNLSKKQQQEVGSDPANQTAVAEIEAQQRIEIRRIRALFDDLSPETKALLASGKTPARSIREIGEALMFAKQLDALSVSYRKEYIARAQRRGSWADASFALKHFIEQKGEEIAADWRLSNAVKEIQLRMPLFEAYVRWRDCPRGEHLPAETAASRVYFDELCSILTQNKLTLEQYEQQLRDIGDQFGRIARRSALIALEMFDVLLTKCQSEDDYSTIFANLAPARQAWLTAQPANSPDGLSTRSSTPSSLYDATTMALAYSVFNKIGHPIARDTNEVILGTWQCDSESALASYIGNYLADRRAAVKTAMEKMQSSTSLIWTCDRLVGALVQEREFEDPSTGIILRFIWNQRRSDEAIVQAVKAALLVAVTIFLSVVTAGATPLVAGAAAVAGLLIDLDQLTDALKEYTIHKALRSANMISKDAEVAWLVLAVAGACFSIAQTAVALQRLNGAYKLYKSGATLDSITAEIQASGVEKHVADAAIEAVNANFTQRKVLVEALAEAVGPKAEQQRLLAMREAAEVYYKVEVGMPNSFSEFQKWAVKWYKYREVGRDLSTAPYFNRLFTTAEQAVLKEAFELAMQSPTLLWHKLSSSAKSGLVADLGSEAAAVAAVEEWAKGALRTRRDTRSFLVAFLEEREQAYRTFQSDAIRGKRLDFKTDWKRYQREYDGRSFRLDPDPKNVGLIWREPTTLNEKIIADDAIQSMVAARVKKLKKQVAPEAETAAKEAEAAAKEARAAADEAKAAAMGAEGPEAAAKQAEAAAKEAGAAAKEAEAARLREAVKETWVNDLDAASTEVWTRKFTETSSDGKTVMTVVDEVKLDRRRILPDDKELVTDWTGLKDPVYRKNGVPDLEYHKWSHTMIRKRIVNSRRPKVDDTGKAVLEDGKPVYVESKHEYPLEKIEIHFVVHTESRVIRDFKFLQRGVSNAGT